MTDNAARDVEQITSIADAVVKLRELRESNKNLNEPDIEEKLARLSLAFKTDKVTLGKRLDLQLRQRDIAEKNIESELKALRESLNALNQLCTETDMREVITKTQQHVDIVQQATMRMSSRAETYGAIQQEQRMNCAFETMLNYVEHLKLLYDKEHLELEDYRRLLAENNLLPHEKGTIEDDPKHAHSLPPRSQSLSGTSKPDSRTRLLSAVCLLNNNHESSLSSTNPGSLSPKNRRSSLPVGPFSHSTVTRVHASIHEKEPDIESRESKSRPLHDNSLSQLESEESCSKETGENPDSEAKKAEDSGENPAQSDSSELISAKPAPQTNLESIQKFTNPLQETTCDSDDVFLLPELKLPVKSSPLNFFNLMCRASCLLLQRACSSKMWKVSNATFILHARYMLSAMLAAAAMLTLLVTFLPKHVIGHLFEGLDKLP